MSDDQKAYVYAVIDAGSVSAIEAAGLDDQPVMIVRGETVAAAISTAPTGKIRPSRKHLSAHHRVVSELAKKARTVMPMSFGMIADDAQSVESWLAEHAEALGETAERLHNRVEMAVRLKWDVENVFEFMVEQHVELKAARGELVEAGDDRETMIVVGELFAKILEAERTEHAAVITDGTRGKCEDMTDNAPRTDDEAVNIAFLIDRGGVKAFENAIFAVAEQLGDEFLLDYSGPLPPHSFANGVGSELAA
ncbi:MAG: GvpL/GvpF family gas vesicle protein [Planctomycetota bacterium]